MDQQTPTGNSRTDLFLYIQSYLMVGITLISMEALLKVLLIGTGVLLNVLGITKHITEYLKTKKSKRHAKDS